MGAEKLGTELALRPIKMRGVTLGLGVEQNRHIRGQSITSLFTITSVLSMHRALSPTPYPALFPAALALPFPLPPPALPVCYPLRCTVPAAPDLVQVRNRISRIASGLGFQLPPPPALPVCYPLRCTVPAAPDLVQVRNRISRIASGLGFQLPPPSPLLGDSRDCSIFATPSRVRFVESKSALTVYCKLYLIIQVLVLYLQPVLCKCIDCSSILQ